jgi:hypothetical protein
MQSPDSPKNDSQPNIYISNVSHSNRTDSSNQYDESNQIRTIPEANHEEEEESKFPHSHAIIE